MGRPRLPTSACTSTDATGPASTTANLVTGGLKLRRRRSAAACRAAPSPRPAGERLHRRRQRDQPLEFTRQRDKLLQALAGLNADVLGLNELENTPGVSRWAIRPTASSPGLNDILGDGTYDFIDTGVIGTDAIRVGLIYKPGVVTPVGDFKLLTTASTRASSIPRAGPRSPRPSGERDRRAVHGRREPPQVEGLRLQ